MTAVPAPKKLTGGQQTLAFVALTKPRIVELLLTTAIPTMFLAAQGLPTLKVVVAVLIGGTLAAGAANTFNSVYDRDIDALMRRTDHRPAALGTISVRAGIIQGLVLSLGSVVALLWLANVISAVLAIVAILLYVVGYTMLLKRRTSQNIVWGGTAGCMPVLIAWSAVTGSLTWTPVVLFLIIFFWTPPHYWPLAMKYRDDYECAGVPMLPVVKPVTTVTTNILVYAVVMVLVSFSLIVVAPMSWIYSTAAVILGALFIMQTVILYQAARKKTDGGGTQDLLRIAMRLFHGSITYLALLFLAVAIDPFIG
ncbi:MAG: protoheme IX farnesyltransferase [Candidatus Nanopelagicales bacterium]|nr:protoheme IX farnesyltransferase [Candidatus Nanopelagicales bacterium]